jgi:hypothetical protein
MADIAVCGVEDPEAEQDEGHADDPTHDRIDP